MFRFYFFRAFVVCRYYCPYCPGIRIYLTLTHNNLLAWWFIQLRISTTVYHANANCTWALPAEALIPWTRRLNLAVIIVEIKFSLFLSYPNLNTLFLSYTTNQTNTTHTDHQPSPIYTFFAAMNKQLSVNFSAST